MPKRFRRIIYKSIYPIWLYWLRLLNKPFESACCIIEYNNKILLVRNSYGDMKWVFPGGHSNKGESQEESVIREVQEEVGISLSNVQKIGSYIGSETFEKHTVNFFYSEVANPYFKIDESEIFEAAWFDWSSFPDPLSIDTKKIIQLYQQATKNFLP